jgi:adenosylcobyric acid synthase
MIQGTGSGVGKSIITAALCRIFKDRGVKVAPFKAQNMALNSFVTRDNCEMGRAQVYQAEACGVEPDVRMNPILLKPSADNCSQVIIMGKPAGSRSAKNYYKDFECHREVVTQAYDSLASEYEVIVIEGAGSPAEINLQKWELVNMHMAAYAKAPVLIVGDIDRGGVFAWMKGTYDLVLDHYRPMIKGFLINKFRGDVSLLEPGIKTFEKIVNSKVLGVIPYFHHISVDEEDTMPHDLVSDASEKEYVTIGMVPVSHLSNFTDFIPLAHEKDVNLMFASHPLELEKCDCIIIPGSKSTISDAVILKQSGWFHKIQQLHLRGKIIVGICGGFQMLGQQICDPYAIESPQFQTQGINLLPLVSTIEKTKKLSQVCLSLQQTEIFPLSCSVRGYEIHMGKTEIIGSLSPLFHTSDISTGVCSDDCSIIGTYVHGFFDDDTARRAFINFLRLRKGLKPLNKGLSYHDYRQTQFENLANHVRQNCSMNEIYELIK